MIMTRVTSNMVRRNYQNNLTTTLGGLESARKQVETGRRFSQSFEDPNSSAKAAILERRYARVEDYLGNVDNAQKWQDMQEDVVGDLSTIARTVAKDYSVRDVNGTNIAIESRSAFAQGLRSLQEQMVVTLNAKYGDTFVLAGNEGKDPPFAINDDGKLTYRGQVVSELNANEDPGKTMLNEHSFLDLGFGLDMDADQNVSPSSAFDAALPGIKLVGYGTITVKQLDADGNPVYEQETDADGNLKYTDPANNTVYYKTADGKYYTDPTDTTTEYTGDTTELKPVYVEQDVQKTDDKGRPLYELTKDDGTQVTLYKKDGNFYDAATGKLYDGDITKKDANGDPVIGADGKPELIPQPIPADPPAKEPKPKEVEVSRNLVDLCGELARVMELPDDQFTYEEYAIYWDEFTDGANDLRDQFAALGTKTQLLTATKSRLENEKLAIQTQYDDAVGINPAEAIMNYSWANYAYNSALKVGASLITPSLLDFMN